MFDESPAIDGRRQNHQQPSGTSPLLSRIPDMLLGGELELGVISYRPVQKQIVFVTPMASCLRTRRRVP